MPESKWKHTNTDNSNQEKVQNSIDESNVSSLSDNSKSVSSSLTNDDLNANGANSSHRRFSFFKFGKRTKSPNTTEHVTPGPLSNDTSTAGSGKNNNINSARVKQVSSIESNTDPPSEAKAITDSKNYNSSSPYGNPRHRSRRSTEHPSSIFERSVQDLDQLLQPSISTPKSGSESGKSSLRTSRKNSIIAMSPCSDIAENESSLSPASVRSSQHIPLPSSSLSNSPPLFFRKRSASMSTQPMHPHHLILENYTSAILDSTVELIANKNMDLDSVDLVQYPHTPSFSALSNQSDQQSKSSSSIHSGRRVSVSRTYPLASIHSTDTTDKGNRIPISPIHKALTRSLSNVNNCGATNQISTNITLSNDPEQPPLERKSISFYSYSDLVNYERSRPVNPRSVSSTSSADTSPTKQNTHDPLFARRKSISLFRCQLEDYIPPDIDEALNTSAEEEDNKSVYTATNSSIDSEHQADDNEETEKFLEVNVSPSQKYKRRTRHNKRNKAPRRPSESTQSAPIQQLSVLSKSTTASSTSSAIDPDAVEPYVPSVNNSPQISGSHDNSSFVHSLNSLHSYSSNHLYFEDEMAEISAICSATKSNASADPRRENIQRQISVSSAKDVLRDKTRELALDFCGSVTG